MEVNEILRKQIVGIIANQLKSNDPPEVKNAYDRLLAEDFDGPKAKKLIGQCLIIELFDVIKNGKPFNGIRYAKNLEALPREPLD